MVTSSLVPSVLFTSSVSTRQLKAIRAFFLCPQAAAVANDPALKIISSTLLPDRSTTYFRSALISFRALYNSELRLIMATDAILVRALLI